MKKIVHFQGVENLTKEPDGVTSKGCRADEVQVWDEHRGHGEQRPNLLAASHRAGAP